MCPNITYFELQEVLKSNNKAETSKDFAVLVELNAEYLREELYFEDQDIINHVSKYNVVN